MAANTPQQVVSYGEDAEHPLHDPRERSACARADHEMNMIVHNAKVDHREWEPFLGLLQNKKEQGFDPVGAEYELASVGAGDDMIGCTGYKCSSCSHISGYKAFERAASTKIAFTSSVPGGFPCGFRLPPPSPVVSGYSRISLLHAIFAA
jgi:hypothetical protein